MARKKRRKKENKLIKRFVRSVLSVVILTAFVLVVSLSVKGLATMDAGKFTKIAGPLLSRLNIKISEEQVGQVAGEFVERISRTGKKEDIDADGENSAVTEDGSGVTGIVAEEGVAYKIALLADSEDAFENLELALEATKSMGVDVILFLGDLTSYGEIAKLQEGKTVLDNSGLEYYIIPGDHDLAASEPPGAENFEKVFDTRNQTVRLGEYKFVLFDNSPNFTPAKESDMDWLEREIDDADFIVLSQPLYHPTSERVMGQIEGQIIGDVKAQAQELLAMVRGFGLKAVFAADHHSFSQYPDALSQGVTHYVIGSLLGTELRNPDGPHFAIMRIFDDGSYSVENVAL